LILMHAMFSFFIGSMIMVLLIIKPEFSSL